MHNNTEHTLIGGPWCKTAVGHNLKVKETHTITHSFERGRKKEFRSYTLIYLRAHQTPFLSTHDTYLAHTLQWQPPFLCSPSPQIVVERGIGRDWCQLCFQIPHIESGGNQQ